MTSNTNGARWPETAGAEADFITVDTSGPGALAAALLRAHNIPHTEREPKAEPAKMWRGFIIPTANGPRIGAVPGLTAHGDESAARVILRAPEADREIVDALLSLIAERKQVVALCDGAAFPIVGYVRAVSRRFVGERVNTDLEVELG